MLQFRESPRPDTGQFKYNLLKSVTLQVKFDRIEISKSLENDIFNIDQQVFETKEVVETQHISVDISKKETPIVSSGESGRFLRFLTKDKLIVCDIFNNNIVLNIAGPIYKSSKETLNPLLEDFIYKCLKILDIRQMNWFSIRKINLFNFGLDNTDDKQTPKIVFSSFNDIYNSINLDSEYNLDQSTSTTVLSDSDSKCVITFGKADSSNLTNLSLYVVDIDYIALKVIPDVKDIADISLYINNQIFNVFCSILSEEIKNKIR